MGTITRALANNITTGGVVASSGISNTSVSAVTSLPSGVDVGDLVLLSEQTASSDASLSFTSGIDSTYDAYCFRFTNCHPATNSAHFTFQGSIDGGSSYGVNITSTYFSAYHAESDGAAGIVYATSSDLAQSTSYQQIADQVKNDNDTAVSGELWLYNPSSTTYVKHFMSLVSNANSSDVATRLTATGYFNTTSAINAIDLKYSSGNLDAGTIKLFGVKKS